MELNTISGLAIAGVICSVVLSMGIPIALFIAGRVKLKARISSFFIGAGTYLLFAMLLKQLLHVLVIQFCGLNAQSRPWLYYVYAALAAAVFEETGRLIAMKFWMKKWLDFPNALMYGIGHGGVEAILLGGLSGISNLVSMLMINSGAMQNTLTALAKEGITSRAEISELEQNANYYRQKYFDCANALERMKTKYNELKEKCGPFLQSLEHSPEVAKLFTEKVKQLFSFKEAQERAEKERQERIKARRSKRGMER